MPMITPKTVVAGRRAAIDAVLDALSGIDEDQAITVFGSVARGESDPGDVDIHVGGGAEVRTRVAMAAMGIACRHYGLLDVFTTHEGCLLVRNAEATGMVISRNAKSLRRTIARDGVPLAQVRNRDLRGEKER